MQFVPVYVSRRAFLPLFRAAAAAVMICAALTSAPAVAAGGVDVPLAWDRNPEPQVVGYVVYVGTTPAADDEIHDVGDRTSFVYSRPINRERYYFSVAAYSAGRVIGQRSPVVSHVIGEGVTALQSAATAATSTAPPASSGASPPLPAAACAAGACYGVTSLTRSPNGIQGVAADPDGRLLIVEGGRRILAYTPGAPRWEIALERHDRQLAAIALDPQFARTRFVYVTEVDDRGDAPELAIVRYRDVRGVLGEPATITTGLPLSRDARAPFTLGPDGNLFVSLPAWRNAGRPDPYAGSILRLTPEGTTPRDAAGGSPIYAMGLADPHALASGSAARPRLLWTAGRHEAGSEWLGYLNLDAPDNARGVLTTIAPADDDRAARAGVPSGVLLPGPTTGVWQCASDPQPRCSPLTGLHEQVVTAAFTAADRSYLVVRHPGGDAELIELRPAPAR
jgi:hypothetical protein